jgi:hypothetical protein
MSLSNAFVPPVWDRDAETPSGDNGDSNGKPRKKRSIPRRMYPWLIGYPVMWFSGGKTNDGETDTKPELCDDSKK